MAPRRQAAPPHGAGPALVVSMVDLRAWCGLCALCYAEFAALGADLGQRLHLLGRDPRELVAWIIGWDLIIEYAMGNVAVSARVVVRATFCELLRGSVSSIRPCCALTWRRRSPRPRSWPTRRACSAMARDLQPAGSAIVALAGPGCWCRVKESARVNTIMVVVRWRSLLFFIVGRRFLRPPENWQAVQHHGVGAVRRRAGHSFLRLHRLSTPCRRRRGSCRL